VSTSIEIVDSHTEGEPTRVVVSGWPLPAGHTMLEIRESLRREQDALRRAVVCEPRGHDAIVGALLTPPVHEGSLAGVVFFNDVGYLGMCGHGLIGVARTLEHLGRAHPGIMRIDTPAGTVQAELGTHGAVSIRNVASYRYRAGVNVSVPGVGAVQGDVAYGGNWFFLTEMARPALTLANLPELMATAAAIRGALRAQGTTGANAADIDHIELSGPPVQPDADSRNFVLCPGAAYDRSPCGTGTSAKLAVLHARGDLAIGQRWRQESITGGRFTGWIEEGPDGAVVPFIQGRAFITARATLFFDDDDPFRYGFPES
jgi:proline racemase